MREHSVNSVDNFICGWYMEDTSICDSIIEYHKVNPEVSEGFSMIKKKILVDKSTKDSLDCSLAGPLLENYYKHLQKIIDSYIEKYSYCNAYAPWSTLEQVNVQYYKPTAGYHAWHTERCSGEGLTGKRHLVFMTYLNDVTDGGETEFFYQKVKIKPEKGLTLIWPADWTFTHRGVASLSQEKYIVTGWFNFL